MIADFSRRYHFSASHRLHVDTLSDEQNWETFGKCNNPHGHGHNYTLEVTVRGPVDEATGMVVNMVDLDTLVQTDILDRFDIQNLNLDPLFLAAVSSTENLCRALWKILDQRDRYGTAQLKSLRMEETSNNFFEYAGEEK
jgi:6-pyruvoyltetrahydropterin/6-carboxytetrahydropterin synthase